MMRFSDVFPFLLHIVQEFYILIAMLSPVNVFTYTKKG